MFCRLCSVLGALRFDPALSVPCVRGALFQNGAGVGRYVFCRENATKDRFKDLAHLPPTGTQMVSVAVFLLCSHRALQRLLYNHVHDGPCRSGKEACSLPVLL